MACSNFWKIDKVDKIVISIILVFFAVFNIFSTFSLASTPVPFNVLSNAIVNSTSMSIVSSTGGRIIYAPLEGNSRYNLSFSISAEDKEPNRHVVVRICRADTVSIGSSVEVLDSFVITDDEKTVSFDFNTYNYNDIFLVISLTGSWWTAIPNRSFVLTNISSSFNIVIDNLFDNVGVSQLWGVFELSIPFIFIVVVSVFCSMIIFNIIKGLSKGKGRI